MRLRLNPGKPAEGRLSRRTGRTMLGAERDAAHRWAGTTLSQPPSVEQGRAYAAEYKLLGNNSRNSARRSAVLANISRSWAALANQLESLAVIEKSEAM